MLQHTPEEEQLYELLRGQVRRDKALMQQLAAHRKSHASALTQTQIAQILQTDQAQISRIESGNANPRIDTLREYAAAIGVEIHYELKLPTSANVTNHKGTFA